MTHKVRCCDIFLLRRTSRRPESCLRSRTIAIETRRNELRTAMPSRTACRPRQYAPIFTRRRCELAESYCNPAHVRWVDSVYTTIQGGGGRICKFRPVGMDRLSYDGPA